MSRPSKECGRSFQLQRESAEEERAELVARYVSECGGDGNPFPIALPKSGRIVVDENCGCGHLRTQHGPTLAFGHGPCRVRDCACNRFTWVGWVYEAETTTNPNVVPRVCSTCKRYIDARGTHLCRNGHVELGHAEDDR